MSTDLDFLPPIINLNPPQISDDVSCAIPSSLTHDDREEEYCCSPKSPRHMMIPPPLRCPPPPKKPRPAARLKRKLSEIRFFESVAEQEIERFFEVVEASFNGSTKRKHCTL
ncbi:hypothetical protein F511_06538 [Dorcoceras hygrometricum]|uniref:Cyclin-dependent protein kinase inhibitor SMR1-like n=1 Tax=Dorcoceras hygrometricum TaxID=472368 RepID=A0A2Z7CJG5_9LAMI|nr:hypothetical protein F511_06538 [Dorcoceras hygrometricum]